MKRLSRSDQRRLDSAFRRAWREDAVRTQHGTCAYCEEPITYKVATSDHVKPRHGGGLDRRKNIVAACKPCNQAKGHMPVKAFRALVVSPPPGVPFAILHAWSRLRINRRLALMEKRLELATGRRG